MDESGIALGVSKHQFVLGSSQTSRVYKKTPENREWVTVIENISAAGEHTKPLVIFKGKSVQNAWFPSNTPDWLYTTSSNGWTSNEIGINWLKNIFLSETRPQSANTYRLLLLDNYGSYLTAEFI